MNFSRPRSRLSLLLAGLPVVLAANMIRPCVAQSSTDEMLDAIVARGTALFSAKLTFEVSSTIERAGQANVLEPNKYLLSVSGQDWILRYHESPDFVMNFHDSTIRFYQTKSEKTGTYRSLQMSAPTSIDEMLGRDYTFAVARNGTLWYRSQLEFVDQQRHRVEERAGEVIDGHPTVLFRWRVSQKDLDDAIIVVPPRMRKDLAGYLHLYAAPGLGYTLPRIDYLTLDGQLARRYESADFIEVDDELFFPKSTTCIAYGGEERHRTAFTVSKVEYVNRDLPDEEFEMQVPRDTRIRDSRPGSPQVVFHLGDQKEIDEVARVVDGTHSKADGFTFRIACLVANGLLALFLLIIWIRRQCRAN